MSSNRKFGITSVSGTLGDGIIANNITFDQSVQTAEARNERGAILDIAAYSKSEQASIDGLYIGNGVEPGSVVSVGNKDFLVTSSNKTESNTDFQQASIQARTADEAVLWPLSAVISGATN